MNKYVKWALIGVALYLVLTWTNVIPPINEWFGSKDDTAPAKQ